MGCGIVLGDAWSGSLGSLLDYRSGAVANRELVKNGAGLVTLFAFDAGQAVAESTAPFDAMMSVIEGRAEITVEGTVHAVGPGDALLLPAHRPHAVAAPERCKLLLTLLRA